MEKRHIVISGLRGAGKTTLIEKLLKEIQVPVTGFFTRSMPKDERGFHAIYIFRPDDQLREKSPANHIGDCDTRNRTINLEVFETVGVEYLQEGQIDASADERASQSAQGIIVMDELGFMETGATAFCDTVLSCFDGDQRVLATLKASHHTDFLNAVRHHPKAEVFEITPENRDELYEELLPIIRHWNDELTKT